MAPKALAQVLRPIQGMFPAARYPELQVGLEVSDDGEGIPAAALPNVFDRFYRTPDSSGRESMGLGLALVKRLAELAGGTVSVWSREGKGATFSVRFPIASRAE